MLAADGVVIVEGFGRRPRLHAESEIEAAAGVMLRAGGYVVTWRRCRMCACSHTHPVGDFMANRPRHVRFGWQILVGIVAFIVVCGSFVFTLFWHYYGPSISEGRALDQYVDVVKTSKQNMPVVDAPNWLATLVDWADFTPPWRTFHLWISFRSDESQEGVRVLYPMTELTYLAVFDAQLTNEAMEAIGRNTSLTALEIVQSELPSSQLTELSGLHRLELLDMQGTSLEEVE